MSTAVGSRLTWADQPEQLAQPLGGLVAVDVPERGLGPGGGSVRSLSRLFAHFREDFVDRREGLWRHYWNPQRQSCTLRDARSGLGSSEDVLGPLGAEEALGPALELLGLGLLEARAVGIGRSGTELPHQ